MKLDSVPTYAHLRYRKVKHRGCHQDYRIYLGGQHVGNIRRGFGGKNGRARSWIARSDIHESKISLAAENPRDQVATRLVDCLTALGHAIGSSRRALALRDDHNFMTLTRDVGARG